MAVPVWVSYDIFARGEIREKSVELGTIGPIDPLSDLSGLGNGASIRLQIGAESFGNISIWRVTLKNIGKVPIRPDDFFRPLRVEVNSPWRIIAITEEIPSAALALDWKSVAPNAMEAQPFLFNPGDHVYQTVYLVTEKPIEKKDESVLKISARIVNLRNFTKKEDPWKLDQARGFEMINLTFLEALSLVAIATVFFLWYLVSLKKVGIADLSKGRARLVIAIAALLSYSVAEIVVYYLSGGNRRTARMLFVSPLDFSIQWQNWLILAIHIGAIVYLLFRSKRNASDRVL